MADWNELLKPEKLGLADSTLVREVHAIDTQDTQGDDMVEASVVLSERIGEDDFNWALLAPVYEAVCQVISQQPGVGWPHVLFFTALDWEAAQRGDFYDEVAEDVAA